MATKALHPIAHNLELRNLWSRYASPFNATMAVTLFVLGLVEMLLARQVHLSGMLQLFDAWPGFLLLLGCLYYCERRPLPKLVESCELTIWAVLSSNVLAGLIQIAARSSFPLADTQIATLDRSMRFETAAIVHVIAGVPILQAALNLSYIAIPVLVFAAVLVPPLFGDRLASRRYVLGVVIATVFTSILFALWPACGPWTTEPMQPTADQVAVTARLMLLKSTAPARLDLQNTAIVSFPSFHVVLALLSATALCGLRRLRIFAWGLAVLTCISTITTGWHYGFDVLGGLAVAAAAWWIARLAVVPEAAHHPRQVFESASEPADSLLA